MKGSIPQPADERQGQPRLRAAVYCWTSAENREKLSTRYLEKVAENPEWTMAGIFFDTEDRKRPEFQRMLWLCQRKKIDLVLTRSVSRSFRSAVDCLTTIRDLRQIGVPVIFEQEGINTGSPDGDLMAALILTFAEAESENITRNSAHMPHTYPHIKRQDNRRRYLK